MHSQTARAERPVPPLRIRGDGRFADASHGPADRDLEAAPDCQPPESTAAPRPGGGQPHSQAGAGGAGADTAAAGPPGDRPGTRALLSSGAAAGLAWVPYAIRVTATDLLILDPVRMRSKWGFRSFLRSRSRPSGLSVTDAFLPFLYVAAAEFLPFPLVSACIPPYLCFSNSANPLDPSLAGNPRGA